MMQPDTDAVAFSGKRWSSDIQDGDLMFDISHME